MKEIGNRFRLVVFDEAHHLPGPTLHEAPSTAWRRDTLGLTATPERADQRERLLDELIGPLVFREDIAEAKGRTLADYSLVRVPIYLGAEEQDEFDRLSRRVRARTSSSAGARSRTSSGPTWRACRGPTPRPARSSAPTAGSSPSSIGRRRSSG